MYVPDNCPIYLELPWIGKNDKPLVKHIVSYTFEDYCATKLQVGFSTRGVFPFF